MQDIELAQKIASILYDKKARDIVGLNVAELTSVCEYMIIATGRSTVQVRALCEAVEDTLSEMGINPCAKEVQKEARWLILDYGFIVVHIFHQEEREFYSLERLWTDGSNRMVLPFDQTVI